MTKAMLWDAFKKQALKKQFGEYFELTREAADKPEMIEMMLERMAYSLVHFSEKMGYRVDKTTADIILTLGDERLDPLFGRTTLGGKMYADLTATPTQFVRHLDDHFAWQERRLDELTTWRGFLLHKWKSLWKS